MKDQIETWRVYHGWKMGYQPVALIQTKCNCGNFSVKHGKTDK
mgnify:CR=1 FL=1